MTALNTEQLIQVALRLAALAGAPADARVWQRGTRISHVLIGFDLAAADLFMARQLGYHAVIGVTTPADDAPTLAGRMARLRANPDRAPSVARLVDLPFVTLGTPLALLARQALARAVTVILADRPAATAADLRDGLLDLPAFAAAGADAIFSRDGWAAPVGPAVSVQVPGAPSDDAPGAGTILRVATHPGDGAWLASELDATNVIALGRCAALSVGIATYIAALRAEGIEVTPFSGVLGDAR